MLFSILLSDSPCITFLLSSILCPWSNSDLEKLRTDTQKTTQLPKLQQNDAQSMEDLQGLSEHHDTLQAITQEEDYA